MLADARRVFIEEKILCKTFAAYLNALDGDEGEWGGWNDGKGITYTADRPSAEAVRIVAKTIRIDGVKAGNGYERTQFEAAWDAISRIREKKPGQTPQKPPLSRFLKTAQTRMGTAMSRFVPVSNPEYGTKTKNRHL